MNVCTIGFSDHLDHGIMYSFDDHKQIIPELKKAVELEGYVLIRRCDLSVIRIQTNTRPVPILFFNHISSEPVEAPAPVIDSPCSVEEDGDYFF